MKIAYRKKTGEVAMLGHDKENNALSIVELPDDPRMKQGYKMTYKNGVIEYEKPWWMNNKEKEDKMKLDFDKDMAEVVNAKNIGELKPLLAKLIKKTYDQ